MASSASLERCTLLRNGGWGIRGEYYASPSISASVISDNKKGGIWCKLYTCKPEVHDSVFLRNSQYEVFNDSPEMWDFSGNWWGSTEPRYSRAREILQTCAPYGMGETRIQRGSERLSFPTSLRKSQRTAGRV